MRGLANGDPVVACGLTPAGVAQARRLGEELRDEELDLCVTSGFERAKRTADEALQDRDVPRLELSTLGDPGYGPYESRPLDEYRTWAWAASSAARPGDATGSPGVGGESRGSTGESRGSTGESRGSTGESRRNTGESRLEVVGRYVDAFRWLIARAEASILVVCHALPMAYLLGARAGDPPAQRIGPVEYATPYRFGEAELAAAVDVLDAWCRAPTW